MNVKLSQDQISFLTQTTLDNHKLFVAPGIFKVRYRSGSYNLIIESTGFRLRSVEEEDSEGYYVYQLLPVTEPGYEFGLLEDSLGYAHSFIEGVAICHNHYLSNI
jgi:hypothetical protein